MKYILITLIILISLTKAEEKTDLKELFGEIELKKVNNEVMLNEHKKNFAVKEKKQKTDNKSKDKEKLFIKKVQQKLNKINFSELKKELKVTTKISINKNGKMSYKILKLSKIEIINKTVIKFLNKKTKEKFPIPDKAPYTIKTDFKIQ